MSIPRALVTHLVDVDTLREDPNNARGHSDRNYNEIAASIRRYGQIKPIVVRNDGVVLAGNATLIAMRDVLGLTQVNVVDWPEDLDDTEATAYGVADNRTAELAHWNDDVLVTSLREIAETDLSLEGTGFDDGELQALIDSLDYEPPTDDTDDDEDRDESPKVVIPVTPTILAAWQAHVDTCSGDEMDAFARLLGISLDG
jgi:ParB-like chromosome segregation protein Spo0J